jgi:hypothetical protein
MVMPEEKLNLGPKVKLTVVFVVRLNVLPDVKVMLSCAGELAVPFAGILFCVSSEMSELSVATAGFSDIRRINVEARNILNGFWIVNFPSPFFNSKRNDLFSAHGYISS